MPEAPLISLIIPTFSRSALLKRTLETVVTQSMAPDQFEVVVVDNASQDDTAMVVKAFIAQHPTHQIRYVLEERMGLVCSRNRGAMEAKAELLSYTDEDVLLDPGFLQAILKEFADPDVHLVTGKSLPDFECDPPDWFDLLATKEQGGWYSGIHSIMDLGDEAHDIDARLCFGVNFATRRSTLIELGGTHPDSSPKKLEWYQGDGETGYAEAVEAAGYRARYTPGALLHHWVSEGRMSFGHVERRMYYQGITLSYTQIRNNGGKLDAEFAEEVKDAGRFDNQPPESTNPLKKLLTAARLVLRSPKTFLAVLTHKQHVKYHKKPKDEREQLFEKMHVFQQQGYAAHQQAVKENPRLLEWILLDSYLDCDFPELKRQDPETAARSY